jgi:hypothetical protein
MTSYYSTWEITDMHFTYGHVYGLFSGSVSPLQRTLPTMQDHIPQIIHQTSPATDRIGVLCSTHIGLQYTSISLNSQYGSLHIEKNGRRFWNQCAKNCSCWRYHCSPNSPWTITLPIPHPASASLPPPDHCARVACKWLLTKSTVNTQFVPTILFTEEAGFTWGSIVNFHNTHVWVDKNPPLLWHQDFNIDFLSMSGWESYVINS